MIFYPLDTVKVRIQKAETRDEARIKKIVRDTYRNEGVRGFYKGVLIPMLGRAPVLSIMFAAKGFGEMQTVKRNPQVSPSAKSFIGGSIAGFSILNMSCTFDLLKIRAQTKRDSRMSYKQELREILAKEGYYGLTRGYMIQLIRDVPGYGTYFVVYENLRRKQKEAKGQEHGFINFIRNLSAGGISSTVANVYGYPIDVIKTRIQAAKEERLRIRDVAQDIIKREGFRPFYRGFGVQFMYSFPSHSFGLYIFSHINDFFKSLI